MKIQAISAKDPAWSAWLKSTDHDFYHLPDYVSTMAEQEGGVAEATIVTDGARALFVPYIVRPLPKSLVRPDESYSDIVSPYGYAGPLVRGDEAFANDALSMFGLEMAKRGRVAGFFRLHPFIGAKQPDRGTVCSRGETVFVDLEQDDETLWKQTASNVRNEIRKAGRGGLEVVFEPLGPNIDLFVAIYDETMRRLGAGREYLFPRDYYERLCDALGDTIAVGIARDATGAPVAASLFVATGTTAQYHLAGSTDSGRRLNASKVILHEARAWARARGATRLHLGGGVGAANDDLFRFKAKFSPNRGVYRTWHVVFDEAVYGRLVARRLHQGAAADQFFPRYRAPLPPPNTVSSGAGSSSLKPPTEAAAAHPCPARG